MTETDSCCAVIVHKIKKNHVTKKTSGVNRLPIMNHGTVKYLGDPLLE